MTVRIIVGDSLEELRKLPAKSVQMCACSPPYYGLRDYGTGEWAGGDPACDHLVGEIRRGTGLPTSPANTRGGGKKLAEALPIQARAACPKCGAERTDGQIGLEPTPEAYVAKIVEVFREVRRVLRDDGTLWVNLGDSYSAGGNGGHQRSGPAGDKQGLEGRRDRKTPQFHGHTDRGLADRKGQARKAPAGFKPKDRLMIPARVALALQADGWWLRDEIVWAKSNPMPESVTDRTTKAHEMIYMFAKSGSPLLWRARDTREWSYKPDLAERVARPTEEDPGATVARWRGFDYYYDADAIAEGVQPDTPARAGRGRSDSHKWADGGPGDHTLATVAPHAGRRLPVPAGWATDTAGHHGTIHPTGRRKNSFARESKDSAGEHGQKPQFRPDRELVAYEGVRNKRSVWPVATQPFPEAHFATYPPALIQPCILAGSPPGGVVLDPFGGAGTTGLVAERLGRACILIELNPEYAAIAAERIRRDNLGGSVEGVARPAPEAGLPLFEAAE